MPTIAGATHICELLEMMRYIVLDRRHRRLPVEFGKLGALNIDWEHA